MMLSKKRTKKRKKHKKSIVIQPEGTCYLCMIMNNDRSYKTDLHRHHVYFGKNHRISEEQGFTVRLCMAHHLTGSYAVHKNKGIDNMLRKELQREYEKKHSREEFMMLIGENYMEE